ncbi:MAG: mandelate racemase/muconate lactonizing enzyme family protein [Methyloligellaceae bacterium]
MKAMKIADIRAHALHVPVELEMTADVKANSHKVCIVEVETDNGLIGHGLSSIGPVSTISHAVEVDAKPAILGLDPLNHEQVWEKLYWTLAPRGQTGIAGHAIAAIDLALWDIKGKFADLPVWKLLGGARDQVPVYATFGFGFYDRDELVEAAINWKAAGFKGLKMTVGNSALQRRDEPRPLADVIRKDVHRVSAVREAVGKDVELYIDANCSLDFPHALELCHHLESLELKFFEEPITQNDVRQMADLRRKTSIPLACGQNEGLAFRFRDLLINEAVDVVQPNVVISGGITQCAKIAAMASAFNVPIDNGGAWPYHNQHLHAGLSNGGLVEYHYSSVQCCEKLFKRLGEPKDGWLQLPDRPGLGFDLDEEALKSFKI